MSCSCVVRVCIVPCEAPVALVQLYLLSNSAMTASENSSQRAYAVAEIAVGQRNERQIALGIDQINVP